MPSSRKISRKCIFFLAMSVLLTMLILPAEIFECKYIYPFVKDITIKTIYFQHDLISFELRYNFSLVFVKKAYY